ncbi:MAG: Flagellar basal body-associated protein FliL [Clostridiales bacterium]|jgi:flagellar FliL protein|nr:Flagellar basal body-associated protein FliL [Clostridiales bacterium]MDN5300107.1 Flagellar basal body-associated protein FliL [Clostridiales bacterium]
MNKKLIIIIAAVVLLLVIVGVVVVVFVLGGEPKEPVIVYSEYQLDEAYSNLADEGGTKIIKYQVVIEYTDDAILTELDSNKTKIVNNIDELMRASLSEDLMKPNGKERIRQKIRDMVIEVLESDEEVISNIYIAPFIIQG